MANIWGLNCDILAGFSGPPRRVQPNGWRDARSGPTPRNELLAALPALPLGQVLYESGGSLEDVYFPTDCIVSLLYVMENGASAEISVAGREGIVGVSVFMGGETTPSWAIVQSAGRGYSLPSSRLKQEFDRHGAMVQLLLRSPLIGVVQRVSTRWSRGWRAGYS